MRICLSASFIQYTVTITQVQESVSDFNPESEWESHKNEDSASLAGCNTYRSILKYTAATYTICPSYGRPLSPRILISIQHLHCVSKKLYPFYFCNNFVDSGPIWMIFGRNVANEYYNLLTLTFLLLYLTTGNQLKCC